MIDFALIKGRIQKHQFSSIISNTLSLLNEIQRKETQGYPIWHLFALIKWTYLYTTDSNLRTPIKDHEFNQLIKLIGDFEGQYRGLSFKNYNEVKRSFRIIAYQQFCHQEHFHNSILGRQIVLFLKISGKVDISNEFQKHSNLDLKDFLEYCYFTYFFFNFDKLGRKDIVYEGYLFESYFKLFLSKWNVVQLEKFLNLITVREKKEFEKLHKLNNEMLQLYETNFFTTKPLLFFKEQYRIPHRTIFVQTIKYFIYDFLKERSQSFPEEFGKRLEKYLELGLQENTIPYFKENQLIQKYSLSKVVDYLIEPDILVEAKAIELHPRSGVMRTKDKLVGDFKHSIVKAYCQLLATANAINKEQQWFGIVVTYKQLFLGFGEDAWTEFLQELTEKFCLENNIKKDLLPVENLFFFTIEDWDHLMQSVKSGTANIKQILTKAKEVHGSTDVSQSVMLMEQLLNRYFPIKLYTLSYLKDRHNELDIL